jgi:gliding motility-associated lipoprotein GldH
MTRKIFSLPFFAVLISFLPFASCSRDTVFIESHAMSGEVWKLSDTPVFEVQINDTVGSNNVIFTIRNGSAYPFRNIYLFATTTSPDGKSITDTLQYNLADEKGKWYGKGFGDIHELNLPYKSNVYFPRKGIYIFKVQHGMRMEDLKGVYDIGLKIVRIKK